LIEADGIASSVMRPHPPLKRATRGGTRPSGRCAASIGVRLALAAIPVVLAGTDQALAESWLTRRAPCETRASSPEPDRDPRLLPDYAISPLVDIFVADTADLELEWRAGRGLTIRPTASAPYVVLPAPVSLQEGVKDRLFMRVDAEKAGTLRVTWIDDVCSESGGECAERTVALAAGEQDVAIPLAPDLRGQARSIRLDAGGLGRVAIRSLRSEANPPPEIHAKERVLISPGSPDAPQSTHHLFARPIPGDGLEIAFFRPPGVPFDPFLELSFQGNADENVYLLVEGAEIPGSQLELFFTSPGCPNFSQKCRTSIPAVGDGLFAVDLSRNPEWRGAISSLRLDFLVLESSDFVVRAMRFVTAEEFSRHLPNDESRRGPLRLANGRLGYRVDAGSSLTCTFEDDQATRRVPDEAWIQIPSPQGTVEFASLRAWWISDAGAREPALRYEDAFSEARAAGGSKLPLLAASFVPVAIEFELVCSENCGGNIADLHAYIEQPLFRVPREKASQQALNLLLISIDTLRADRLSLYGHSRSTDPFLREFAERSTVYDRVYAVDTWTVPTHAAMFTGKYPHQLPHAAAQRLPESDETLAEILSSRGYRTIAFADGVVLTAERGLDQGFDVFDSRFEPFSSKIGRFIDTVARAASRSTPVFAFLHTYVVHAPYSLAPDETAFFDRSLELAGTAPAPVSAIADDLRRIIGAGHGGQRAAFLKQVYDDSIVTADQGMRRVLEAPELQGFLRNAVVVVTSDHGEEFLERGSIEHNRQLPYPEVTHVPLIVHRPGQHAAERKSSPISQTAIFGMILSDLGVDAPVGSAPCSEHGVPLSILTGEGPSRYPVRDFLSLGAFSEGWERLEVYERKGESLVYEEMVALDDSATPPPLERLRAAISCLRGAAKGGEKDDGKGSDALTESQRGRLRALGYLSD
jgi:hypothetical protein